MDRITTAYKEFMHEKKREMEKKEEEETAHVFVLPYSIQGHINPMLQFSKRLLSKGLSITLLLTTTVFFDTKSLQGQPGTIKVETFSDDAVEVKNFEQHLSHFRQVVTQKLEEVISVRPTTRTALVYDSILPWALDIARQFGLVAAPFFTQSCSVNAIYNHIHQGLLTLPIQSEITSVSILGLPTQLDICHLPTFITNSFYRFLGDLQIGQFSNLRKTDTIFVNTFDSLEQEVVNWMAKEFPIKNIGPTIPSKYLDKRLKDDKDYGLSLFKPETDSCRKWLDTKDEGSVVYVSFGSLAALGEAQMEEIANGLKQSNRNFLWVVRKLELEKLPTNFTDEVKEKGLVVTWCSQLEVLAHKAVGCFVTHCGWNSTLEALSLGVPMVAIPYWSDQTTNAKLVMDVWRVGVTPKLNNTEMVTRDELELCIGKVMGGDEGLELKRNSEKWKQLAREAVDEGGSSDKSIEEFVATLSTRPLLSLSDENREVNIS